MTNRTNCCRRALVNRYLERSKAREPLSSVRLMIELRDPRLRARRATHQVHSGISGREASIPPSLIWLSQVSDAFGRQDGCLFHLAGGDNRGGSFSECFATERLRREAR